MQGLMLKTSGVRIVERNELLSYDVPVSTYSYTPISNKEIVETTLEELDKNNFYVHEEFHKSAGNGNKFVGGFIVKSGDTDMDLMFGYKNSYDKSMSAAYCVGSQIVICSNGCINGEEMLVRRHVGNANVILKNAISQGVKKLYDNYSLIKKELDTLKEIELTKKTCAELIGRMYIEENIVKANQLSILKGEIEQESYDYGVENSAYNLYQAVSHSLKKSHPISHFQDHVKLHNFFLYNEELYC